MLCIFLSSWRTRPLYKDYSRCVAIATLYSLFLNFGYIHPLAKSICIINITTYSPVVILQGELVQGKTFNTQPKGLVYMDTILVLTGHRLVKCIYRHVYKVKTSLISNCCQTDCTVRKVILCLFWKNGYFDSYETFLFTLYMR